MQKASPTNKRSWAPAFFLAASSIAHTEERNLFELSLDQLMQVNVVSKSEENLILSPGVVSVYTVKELTALGLYTLPDMLSFTTGVEVVKTLNGIQVIQVRGLADAYNQKVLFLLDGVPYWMPSHGDVPLSGVPIASIEKIEVIRGPASVVYGTNSSSSVINLVTKKQQINEWQLSTIDYGNIKSSFYASHSFEGSNIDNASLDIAFEIQDENGYQAKALNTFGPFDNSCRCFPNIAESNIENKSDHISFWLKYQQDDLSLTLQKFRENLSTYTNGIVLNTTDYQIDGELIALSYLHSVNDTNIDLNTSWNRFYWARDVTNILGFIGVPGDGTIDFENGGSGNYRWRTSINLKHKIDEQWSFLSGLEHEIRQTENNKFRDGVGGSNLLILSQPPFNLPFQIDQDGSVILIGQQKITENSLFLQADYRNSWWRMVIGARYIDNEFSDNHLAPRLSFVINQDDNQSWKFLYGEGFNSPTFRQLSARNNFGAPSNVNVTAEIIKTLEVSYNRIDANLHQSISLFEIRAEDLIQLSTNSVFNSDQTVKRNGIEYEFQLRGEQLRFLGSLSYLKQGHDQQSFDPAAFFTAQWQAKLGTEYINGNHRFGASIRATSKKADASEYHLINAKYSYGVDRWQMYIGLNNVTDQEVFHPNVGGLGASQTQSTDNTNLIFGGELRF